MLFSPEDPRVGLVDLMSMQLNGIAMGTTTVMFLELVTGEAKIYQVIADTRDLLDSVDAATTVAQNELKGDVHIDDLARHWAFFGPGISNQLDRLRKLQSYSRTDLMILACCYAFLNARKMSLELNKIDVPKIKVNPPPNTETGSVSRHHLLCCCHDCGGAG